MLFRSQQGRRPPPQPSLWKAAGGVLRYQPYDHGNGQQDQKYHGLPPLFPLAFRAGSGRHRPVPYPEPSSAHGYTLVLLTAGDEDLAPVDPLQYKGLPPSVQLGEHIFRKWGLVGGPLMEGVGPQGNCRAPLYPLSFSLSFSSFLSPLFYL